MSPAMALRNRRQRPLDGSRGRGAARAGRITAAALIAALGCSANAGAQDDRFAGALIELHASLDGVYGDEGGDVRRLLEELAAALGQWDRSIQAKEAEVRRAIDRGDGAAATEGHVTLASLYLARGRSREAVTELDAAVRLAPARSDVHRLHGHALEAAGRRDEAAAAYRRAWTRAPDDPDLAYLALTHSMLPDGEASQARDTLLSTIRMATRGTGTPPSAPFLDPSRLADNRTSAPVFPPARYTAGFALIARGEHEDGIAELRRASREDPLLADPAVRSGRMNAAGAAVRTGDLAAARAELELAVAGEPGSSEAHRLLATVHALTGDPAGSAAHLRAAIGLKPDDERSWTALARTQQRQGAVADATRTLEAALDAIGGSGSLTWALAELLREQKRTVEARQRYVEAAGGSILSGRATVHQWVATLSSLQQDVTETARALEGRVGLDLNDAAAHRDLASVYTKQGRHDEAFAELAMAGWLDPADPFTFVALGHNHLAQGRQGDAVEALQRAVMLRPDLPEARYAFAQALTRAGRREAAREHLVEFQRLRAAAEEAEARQSEIAAMKVDAARLAAAGEYPAAAALWTTVAALDAGVADPHIALADVLVSAGDLEGALRALVKAAELNGVAEVHLKISDVLKRLGRTRESALARQTYERLLLEDLRRRGRR